MGIHGRTWVRNEEKKRTRGFERRRVKVKSLQTVLNLKDQICMTTNTVLDETNINLVTLLCLDYIYGDTKMRLALRGI